MPLEQVVLLVAVEQEDMKQLDLANGNAVTVEALIILFLIEIDKKSNKYFLLNLILYQFSCHLIFFSL